MNAVTRKTIDKETSPKTAQYFTFKIKTIIHVIALFIYFKSPAKYLLKSYTRCQLIHLYKCADKSHTKMYFFNQYIIPHFMVHSKFYV